MAVIVFDGEVIFCSCKHGPPEVHERKLRGRGLGSVAQGGARRLGAAARSTADRSLFLAWGGCRMPEMRTSTVT